MKAAVRLPTALRTLKARGRLPETRHVGTSPVGAIGSRLRLLRLATASLSPHNEMGDVNPPAFISVLNVARSRDSGNKAVRFVENAARTDGTEGGIMGDDQYRVLVQQMTEERAKDAGIAEASKAFELG